MAGIYYSDYYISEKNKTIEDVLSKSTNIVLPAGCNSINEYSELFKQQTGLDNISYVNKERVISLFDQMLMKMFENTGIKPEEIAYFVSVDLYSNSSENVSISSYLHNKYGMDNSIMFSLHQGCSSTMLAMGLADRLLDEGKKYMLIISSCFALSEELRYIGTTIVGDALGLMLIDYEGEKNKILDLVSLSDGKVSFDSYNGKEFKPDVLGVVKKGVSVIKKVISENDLEMDDIRYIIPQSINYQKYAFLYPKMLGIKKEKMFLDNIPYGGHLGDVDIIRNFTDFYKKNHSPNNYYVLYGIGGPQGMDKSYNAVLIKTGK